MDDNLKQLANLHDENIELKKEIERLKADREWISVGTKMPEIAQKVLVHFGKIDNTLIGYLAYGKNNAETWVVYYKDGECLNDGEFAETITHWMPLPKEPKQ